jgi:prepilin-type processing-associated H-X9-DG protein
VKAPRSKIPIWLVVLCVVGISLPVVAILAALLLPALSQAKNRARQIICMNNMKQLALGVRMYSSDNKDTFPAATNWCEAMTQYVSPGQSTPSSRLSVFTCPTQPERRCSYAYNRRLSGVEEGKVDPQTVLIFESDAGWDAAGGPELASAHHKKMINVAFADGHVEAVPVSQLPNLRWDPAPRATAQ